MKLHLDNVELDELISILYFKSTVAFCSDDHSHSLNTDVVIILTFRNLT